MQIHGHVLSHQAPDRNTTAIKISRIMQNLAVLCMSEQNFTQMNNRLPSQLAASWCKTLKASDETVFYQQRCGMGFLKVLYCYMLLAAIQDAVAVIEM